MIRKFSIPFTYQNVFGLYYYCITSLNPLADSRLIVDIDIVVTISNDSGNKPLLDGGGGSRTVIFDQQ